MKLAFTLLILLSCVAGCSSLHRGSSDKAAKIPVILDTDIGDDIDDTYAVVMLLKSPRFDVKLITTTAGQPQYRAQILAKLLTIAHRTDIPIGLGAGESKQTQREAAWIADFPLANYPNIRRDGVQAMIDTVNRSERPVTIIGIGPLQTIAAALDRDPSIAPKSNFVGMQGSVFKGYGGKNKPDPEWNVFCNIPASQKVFAAPWRHAAITPLDTCGLPQVSLDAKRFAELSQSSDPLAGAIVESYAAWQKAGGQPPPIVSTTLYDTVAIYLADPSNSHLLKIEPLKLVVTDKGLTAVSPTGRNGRRDFLE